MFRARQTVSWIPELFASHLHVLNTVHPEHNEEFWD